MGGIIVPGATIHGAASSPGIPLADSPTGGFFQTPDVARGYAIAGRQFEKLSATQWLLGYAPPAAIVLSAVSGSPFPVTNTPRSFAVSPNGLYLVTGNDAFGVSAYSINPVTGALTHLADYAISFNVITQVIFSADGLFVYAVNANHSIIQGYSINGAGALTSIGTVAILSTTKNVQLSLDGKFVYASFSDGISSVGINVYSRNTTTGAINGTAVQTVALLHLSNYYLGVSTNGVYAASDSFGSVEQYTRNTSTGLLVSVGSPIAIGANITQVVISPSGNYAYVMRDTNNVYGYSCGSNGLLSALSGSPFAVGGKYATISADGNYFIAISSAGTVTFSTRTNGILASAATLGVAAGLSGGIAITSDNVHIMLLNTGTSAVGVLQTVSTPTFPLIQAYFDPLGITGFINFNGTVTVNGTAVPSSGFANPMSVLGDVIYGGASGVAARLPGNITTVPLVLTSVGDGVNSTAPSWQPAPVAAEANYMLANAASDIATYDQMPSLPAFTSGALGGVTQTATVGGVLLQAFASNIGYPNVTKIPAGIFIAHYETTKAAGANNYYTYYEVWKRTAGGSETKLVTSDNSSQSALNTTIQNTVSATMLTDATLLATDRLVIKIYAVMLASTASITLNFDSTTNARLSVPSAVVDSTNFVPYAGATADINMGNKHINSTSIDLRVSSQADAASITPNTDNFDVYAQTAQAQALTINNPTWAITPIDGQPLLIKIKDNGTARALAFGANFIAFGSALPTTTVINKTMLIMTMYNAATGKHMVLPFQQEQ